MDIGYLIGWLGILFGLMVGPAQLYKLYKTKSANGISLATYVFLCAALVCYLLHAIYIHSLVFTIAQSINLSVNSVILFVLLKHRRLSSK